MKDLKKQISALLDSAYELEGLLHLALERDEIKGHLLELIADKAKELTERSTGLKPDENEPEPKVEKPAVEAVDVEEREEDLTATYQLEDEPAEEPSQLDQLSELDQLDQLDQLGELEDSAQSAQPVPADLPKRKVQPVFSLNDRFLFCRVLFGGDMADFNSHLNMVSSLHTFEDARQYFYDEVGLNPDDEETERFMMAIRESFEK